jgi:phage gp16-like protein
MRKFDPATQRTRQLAAIHVIAQKQLRLDRQTYIALLQRVGGVSSAADLDAHGRVRVLRELGRLAGDGDKQMSNAITLPDAPQNVRNEIASMVSKVGAILAEIGKPWGYAHGMARKMFKIQRVEWLRPDQLHRLVAALQISANRRKS